VAASENREREKGVKPMPDKFAVTLNTLSWHYHIRGDIERGVELYKNGNIEFMQYDKDCYSAIVPISAGEHKEPSVIFTSDGRDLEDYRCGCAYLNERHGQLCQHVVAAVLAVQGGLADESASFPKELTFRAAEREDTPLIFHLICELAEYEKLLNRVKTDAETLESWLFDKHAAEVIISEVNGTAVGYALFFSNFSTFLGKAGLYLEDLYVKQQFRGHGIGKATFANLAKIAIERDYGRVEWSCLYWNKPSIDFYRSLGAEAMSDWTTYRLSEETLTALAEREVTVK
jgi:GNAT superfamily N-acetyltransferase